MPRIREFDTDAAVEAAMSAFRRTGYEGTSVQDLVAATGVGRGSLYAAFGNKESLYLAAVDLYRERYAVPLTEILRGGVPAPELIRDVMVGLVDEIVRDGRRQACLIVSAAMERAHHDVRVAERLRATTGALEEALFDVIVQGQAAGQISDRCPALDLARFLVMTMQGVRVMGAINPDRRTLMSSVNVALTCLD
jgi:TetR/AcrR family transcriptional repressor of nem operon